MAGAMAALYAPAFIAASPLGVMAPAGMTTPSTGALSDGYAQYRAIGTIGMRVRGVTLSPIDRLHAVAPCRLDGHLWEARTGAGRHRFYRPLSEAGMGRSSPHLRLDQRRRAGAAPAARHHPLKPDGPADGSSERCCRIEPGKPPIGRGLPGFAMGKRMGIDPSPSRAAFTSAASNRLRPRSKRPPIRRRFHATRCKFLGHGNRQLPRVGSQTRAFPLSFSSKGGVDDDTGRKDQGLPPARRPVAGEAGRTGGRKPPGGHQVGGKPVRPPIPKISFNWRRRWGPPSISCSPRRRPDGRCEAIDRCDPMAAREAAARPGSVQGRTPAPRWR